MPDLDWSAFESLPGDRRDNFEKVCRAVTSNTYARCGRFAARAQQPGVEFHLNIELPACSLGDPGRWFGWQTKWWDIPGGRAISNNRKADVTDSIAKTEEHVPGITDWVLWTRRPLTASDQTWFYGLKTNMRLHLWNEAELEAHLIGDARLLREAYFGELILTSDRLADLHERAAAEVGERWMPDVHLPPPAERVLRKMLGEPEAWNDLNDYSNNIERYLQAVPDMSTDLDGSLAAEVGEIVDSGRELVEALNEIYTQLRDGSPTALIGPGRRTVAKPPTSIPPTLRRLRSKQHRAALPMTNLIAHMRTASELVENVERHLTTRIAVATGGAGFGKTQLAATLSAGTDSRPSGILLHGGRLAHRQTLDDLATQITIAGRPMSSFDELLAAVDAAAERAGCRLPIVIDGLNEAEVASDWAPLLRRLDVTLGAYPSVLILCTVREAFLTDAIPPEVTDVLNLTGFDADLEEAIARYFAFYKIDPGDAELPLELLDHPLTLKIYCSVANPDRRDFVSVDKLPSSLTGMFNEYVLAAGRRIFDLVPTIRPHDVARALDLLGAELWNTRRREITEQRVRELLGDNGPWQQSVLAALEHEGLLIRQPGAIGGNDVAIVYDLLAGHIIATSLLRNYGQNISAVLGEESTTNLFIGDWDERHPLAVDIFDALAGTMPRLAGSQLWQVVEERLRLPALLRSADLEADQIDTPTVEAIARNLNALGNQSHDILDHLYTTRAAAGHPLNAEFLSQILEPLSLADRDLRWSEWLRANSRRLHADAHGLAKRWRQNPERSPGDRLRARWLMWTLTSNDRDLRDAATAALYWFGRHDVDYLFDLATESLTLNDAYIGERVIAAAYGVATTFQSDTPGFAEVLGTYLTRLAACVIGADSTAPTYHSLTRYYIAGTFEFADRYYPDAVPPEMPSPLPFAPGAAADPLPGGDPRRDEVDHTLGMNFGNYTLGRLFPDRANYDDTHVGHREATDRLLGIVYDLGWREDRFGETDRRISNRRYEAASPRQVERYGKKYCWIAYHMVAGLLADQGAQLDWLEVDIDPTFPQAVGPVPVSVPTWARRTPGDEVRWLRNGVVNVPEEFWAPSQLDGDEGPWLLVHAEINTKDVATGRRAFGLFNTVLVDQEDADTLVEHFVTLDHPGRDLIDIPSAYYVFAGEVPWHHRFAQPEPGGVVEDYYVERVRGLPGEISFEVLAHHFGWESHNSSENQVQGDVPSRLLSEAADLRQVPGSLDQVDPRGRTAARSFAGPEGYSGFVLYARADVLRDYAGSRALVTFGWGERETQFAWPERPSQAIRRVYASHANIWRHVRRH